MKALLLKESENDSLSSDIDGVYKQLTATVFI